MKSLKCLSALALVIVIATSVRAQEEQWMDYLGKPFDSVVNTLKANGISCEKEIVTNPLPAVQATCLPYQFLGEYGILVLRRSDRGVVEACSWVRGGYAGIESEIAKLKTSELEKLAVENGDLDRAFDATWNHYTLKLGISMDPTEDGGYLWKTRKVNYELTRASNRIEFTLKLKEPLYTENQSQQASAY